MALSKSEEEIPLTYFMWLKIDFSPLFSPPLNSSILP